MKNWERAWEREKLRVGEEVHRGWMEEKLRQGFADHPWRVMSDEPNQCAGLPHFMPPCPLPKARHHTDMLPFAELPPHIQEYDYQTGIIAFRIGFEAGARTVFDELEARGVLP